MKLTRVKLKLKESIVTFEITLIIDKEVKNPADLYDKYPTIFT